MWEEGEEHSILEVVEEWKSRENPELAEGEEHFVLEAVWGWRLRWLSIREAAAGWDRVGRPLGWRWCTVEEVELPALKPVGGLGRFLSWREHHSVRGPEGPTLSGALALSSVG